MVPPEIYHIVHMDRLESIIRDGFIWCDTKVAERSLGGTTIGMPRIKERRKQKNLQSAPHLTLADCVPFNFCPRSVMLFVLYKGNQPELPYRGGQDPIVHLKADMRQAVDWAESENLHWAFTTENAVANSAADYSDWSHRERIQWEAVNAGSWYHLRGPKQAEFLVQEKFPWRLVSQIGVRTKEARIKTLNLLQSVSDRTPCEVRRDWYY